MTAVELGGKSAPSGSTGNGASGAQKSTFPSPTSSMPTILCPYEKESFLSPLRPLPVVIGFPIPSGAVPGPGSDRNPPRPDHGPVGPGVRGASGGHVPGGGLSVG